MGVDAGVGVGGFVGVGDGTLVGVGAGVLVGVGVPPPPETKDSLRNNLTIFVRRNIQSVE